MGFNLSWVAARGIPRELLCERVGLQSTDEFEEFHESEYDGFALATGWEVIVARDIGFVDGLELGAVSAGVEVVTSYWWPPPPTGPTAGYTAPLIRWEQTTITGLASQPIVLSSYWSQSYRPHHHNFGADYIFEPRLEPGISAAIVAELAAADIVYLHVYDQYDGDATFMVAGADGVLRPL